MAYFFFFTLFSFVFYIGLLILPDCEIFDTALKLFTPLLVPTVGIARKLVAKRLYFFRSVFAAICMGSTSMNN
jgi:hypothetical protein